MSSGTDQIARLLALPPFLQHHPGISLTEAAEAFGVSERRLRGDLEVLQFLGPPGRYPGEIAEVDLDSLDREGLIFVRDTDFLPRPLRFTPHEVAALVVVLRSLTGIAGTDTAAAVASALAKLEAISPDAGDSADRVEVRVVGADGDLAATVEAAIEQGQRLRIVHGHETRGETTTREVDPFGISLRDGFAYLEAWALGERPGWRTFRLDRIESITCCGQAVDHGEPPARERDWLATAPEVELTVDAETAWIAEYLPIVTDEPAAEGGRRIRLRVADMAFLSRLILRLGAGVRDVSPVTAARAAAEQARAALSAYAETATP